MKIVFRDRFGGGAKNGQYLVNDPSLWRPFPTNLLLMVYHIQYEKKQKILLRRIFMMFENQTKPDILNEPIKLPFA